MTSSLVAAGLVAACSSTAPARAQLVVVVDTDAPLVGQLPSNAKLSQDSAVDTLRVDVLDAKNAVADLQTFIVPEAATWPVSFGVAATAGTEVRLRIRLFRGRFGHPATESGLATAEAPSQITIERLARVTLPASGVERVRLLLHEDCFGVASSFLGATTTCIDADHLAGTPAQGIEVLSDGNSSPTRAGSWAPAFEVPCESADPTRICIPGGFSILGEETLVGYGETREFDPLPYRPVIVSPFLLDKNEYTVGRFRALLKKGSFSGELPHSRNAIDPVDTFCTWGDVNDASSDSLPLNCVTWETAAAVCQIEGGSLPTEAQWEHAARGRGERRPYPWGDRTPSCCTASLSRIGPIPSLAACKQGTGVEPAGSHPLSASCSGLGDVSRDGVQDLGASLSELLADKFEPYDAPCWNPPGILHDPRCDATDTNGHASRGADWSSGLSTPLGALRGSFADADPFWGFRCTYPAVVR